MIVRLGDEPVFGNGAGGIDVQRIGTKYIMVYESHGGNRGATWNNKGEHDKAIEDYTEAIRIVPTFALPYYNRGNAWEEKAEHDKAIADYTEAIEIEPKAALAYAARGKAWKAKGDKAKAEADFKEAKRLDPSLELNNE